MKRLNPETGQPLKRGDRRKDGFYFCSYNIQLLTSDGYFKENWRSESGFIHGHVAWNYFSIQYHFGHSSIYVPCSSTLLEFDLFIGWQPVIRSLSPGKNVQALIFIANV